MLTEAEFEHAIANVMSVHIDPAKIDDEFRCWVKSLDKRFTPEQLAKITNAQAVRLAAEWAEGHAKANPQIGRKKSTAPSRSAEQDAAEVRALSARAAMKARKITY